MTIDVSTDQRDLTPADSRGWPAEARETVCHLAHDLCQPIAAIRALAYATPAEAEAPVLQRLRQISEEAAWIAEIVDDLLGGPRTSPLRRFDRTEIHELIRDVVASQRLTYTGRIVLHQASGSACYVAGSPAKLRRALANVVANATRAAGADGSVELTGRTLEDMAVIEIADSGPGFGRIAPVHGIGLRIARRVLAECEGHISFERRPPVYLDPLSLDRGLVAETVDDDVRPLLGEGAGDRQANAARRAGDEGVAFGERHRRFSSSDPRGETVRVRAVILHCGEAFEGFIAMQTSEMTNSRLELRTLRNLFGRSAAGKGMRR